MKNISTILVVILAVLFTLPFNAGADTQSTKVFKCSGEKIEIGESTYSVLKKCGEPAYQEVLTNEGCDKEEKWHYDCIGQGYVEELVFLKGVLVDRLRGDKSQGSQKCK